MSTADVQLHNVSVVIAAKFHNPSILNKDFLENKKIVPKNWETVETISTPAVSVIRYGNGITWMVDQQTLEINQECDIPFKDRVNDKIHDLAKSYVEILPHVPYKSIGLNCIVSIANEDPLRWMTQKFLDAQLRSRGISMMPRFVINTDSGMLNFSFGDGTIQRDGEQTRSVIVECNHHFAKLNGVNDARHILATWKNSKNIIAAKLKEVVK